MKRVAIAGLLVLGLAVPVTATAGEFGKIVSEVSRSTKLSRTWIPFLGVARTFVRTTHPDGIYDFRVALFEGKSKADVGVLHQKVRAAVGPEWTPMIVAKSKRQQETALVFMRETKRGVRLLIVAYEPDEVAVVEVEVKPEKVAEFISGDASVKFGR
jgi:hypothetical protein